MSVPFTQYMLPDGRAKEVSINLDEETENKAKAIIDKGYNFECEVLTNGICSFTIADRKKEEDVDIELCNNGPCVPIAIKAMINRFYSTL